MHVATLVDPWAVICNMYFALGNKLIEKPYVSEAGVKPPLQIFFILPWSDTKNTKAWPPMH
jgi:hypothetical protein